MENMQDRIKIMELAIKLAKLSSSGEVTVSDLHVFDEYSISDLSRFKEHLLQIGITNERAHENYRVSEQLDHLIILKKARLLDKANDLVYVLMHTYIKGDHGCTDECETDWQNSRMSPPELEDLISILRQSQTI